MKLQDEPMMFVVIVFAPLMEYYLVGWVEERNPTLNAQSQTLTLTYLKHTIRNTEKPRCIFRRSVTFFKSDICQTDPLQSYIGQGFTATPYFNSNVTLLRNSVTFLGETTMKLQDEPMMFVVIVFAPLMKYYLVGWVEERNPTLNPQSLTLTLTNLKHTIRNTEKPRCIFRRSVTFFKSDICQTDPLQSYIGQGFTATPYFNSNVTLLRKSVTFLRRNNYEITRKTQNICY